MRFWWTAALAISLGLTGCGFTVGNVTLQHPGSHLPGGGGSEISPLGITPYYFNSGGGISTAPQVQMRAAVGNPPQGVYMSSGNVRLYIELQKDIHDNN